MRSFVRSIVRSLGVIFVWLITRNEETEETKISERTKKKRGECQSSGIQKLNIEGKQMKIDFDSEKSACQSLKNTYRT